ncbi:DMT family transporter [Brevirhabdus sp.]|uniref:DMT family transporter n=1 Tax=Brevirhabdus sp. TaxID=2004514 RepID=UPI0040594A04
MSAARGAAPAPTLASFAMIAALGVIWGGSFIMTELALEGITSMWLAAFRLLLATPVLAAAWAFTRPHGAPPPDIAAPSHDAPQPDRRARWPYLLAIGLLSSVLPFNLLAWGQQSVTSAFAGVSMAGVTLFVLPLAHFLVPGERMTLRRTLGFLVGFAGVLLLLGGGLFGTTGDPMEPLGRLACIAATLCYAVGSILVRLCPPIAPITLTFWLTGIGAAAAAGLALLVEGVPPVPPQGALLAVLFLGAFSTAFANLLRVVVIRSAGPTFMSLTNYMVPAWSMIFGAAVLSEPLPGSLFTALLLILSGLLISQWSALRRLSHSFQR